MIEGESLPHDMKILNIKDGDKMTNDDLLNSPVGVFIKMEAENPEIFNIERLVEFTWNAIGGDEMFWLDFASSGIYNKLQWLFYFQFGSGMGKPMLAGTRVAQQLNANDVVINLNYDVAFDLALKQAGREICYAPHSKQDVIHLLKPHGSINLYYNYKTHKSFFSGPEKMAGSVSVDLGAEGIFDPYGGIIPPRLNKTYKLLPMARAILDTVRPYNPSALTFWGIGLAESDLDLLSIYREAAGTANVIEFINPDKSAYEKAALLLGKQVKWFETLGEWLLQYGVSYP